MWMPYLKIRALYRSGSIDELASGILPVWIAYYLNFTGVPTDDRKILKELYDHCPGVLEYAFSRRIEENSFVTKYVVMTYYLPEEPRSYYTPEYFYYGEMMDFDIIDLTEKREIILMVHGKKRGCYIQDPSLLKDAVCRMQPTDIYIRSVYKEVLYRKKGLKGTFIFIESSDDVMFRIDAVDLGVHTVGISLQLWERMQKFVYIVKTVLKYESLIVYDGDSSIEVYIQGNSRDIVESLFELHHPDILFPEGAPSGTFVMPEWCDIEPIQKMRFPGSINHNTGRICMLLDKSCMGRGLDYLRNINSYF